MTGPPPLPSFSRKQRERKGSSLLAEGRLHKREIERQRQTVEAMVDPPRGKDRVIGFYL